MSNHQWLTNKPKVLYNKEKIKVRSEPLDFNTSTMSPIMESPITVKGNIKNKKTKRKPSDNETISFE